MGANHSSGDGPSDASKEGRSLEPKLCYYDLLGVDSKATEDEIKKAYRKKALELHPDRNYGHVEDATKRFADVQSAYEVLSDPQERIWYNAHRGNILYGGEYSEVRFENDIRCTSADEVLRFISKVDFRIDFSASSMRCFTAINEVFDGLAKEEEAASKFDGVKIIEYASFGQRDDSHDDVVRPFYAMWSGFATAKKFSWKDLHRYSEAPDRKVRRMMEKENKRFREDGIREFNDAVRSLVAFIRKRDPRCRPNKQSEADRQKALRDATVAQAARSRAANEAKLADEAIPEWMNPTNNESTAVSDEEKIESDSSRHEVQCVVCNKTFKSENQYEAHERSKKHIKAVQRLRRQLLKEDRNMNLHGTKKAHSLSSEVFSEVQEPELHGDRNSLDQVDLEYDDDSQPESATKIGGGKVSPQVGTTGPVDPSHLESEKALTDDSFPHGITNNSLLRIDENFGVEDFLDEQLDGFSDLTVLEGEIDAPMVEATDAAKQLRIGKAKEKRVKKAAQKSMLAVEKDSDFSCAACRQLFASKNQLFKHMKSAGHAQSIEKKGQGKG